MSKPGGVISDLEQATSTVVESFKVHDLFALLGLNTPIWQDHSPLVLGWSDQQVRPIADGIAPMLAPHLTHDGLMAAASMARSVVTEHLTSGRGTYYSRAKDFYQRSRYRNDPRYSWFFVTNAADALVQAGLVTHEMGIWVPGNKGRRSTMWPTTALVDLVAPLINCDESREQRSSETIVLRDRDEKTNIEYTETAGTAAMRDEMAWLNHHLAQSEIRHRGHRIETPALRRIFNGDFTRGGRLYVHGDSWQNMPKKDRQSLTFVIDRTAHAAVEMDYANLHIRMAYAKADQRCPAGDLYKIDGFDRDLVKLAVNVLFNAASRRAALAAIDAEIMKNLEWRYTVDRDTLARRVIKAIHRRHHRIKKFFHSDCGAGFQHWDSEIAIKVMSRMIELTGRCPLPVHDSFLCADVDASILDSVMIEALKAEGISTPARQSAAPRAEGISSTSASPSYPLGGNKVSPGQMKPERPRTKDPDYQLLCLIQDRESRRHNNHLRDLLLQQARAAQDNQIRLTSGGPLLGNEREQRDVP